ncbi:hypothetical protein I4F81_006137 [Pyropia yezoensis]|uniref:Uncharacterized protein n=1 Tax=Pyropia yezoensis TaxID=2788 RepID=A0ACC3C1D4_PYRYE|nr:hypothetical protein I4F81_006137 [Neopyropia yezoensis]
MACRPPPAVACAWVTVPFVAAAAPSAAAASVAAPARAQGVGGPRRPRLSPPPPTLHRAPRGSCTPPACGVARRSSFLGLPCGGLPAAAAAAGVSADAGRGQAAGCRRFPHPPSDPHHPHPQPSRPTTEVVTMGLPLLVIPPLVLQAAAVNGALIAAATASRQQALTPAGVRHAAALGLLLWSAMGAAGWGLCVAFLVGGTALTRVGRASKEAAGIAEGRGGRRGPENVWGAGAAGALCAVGMLLVGGAGGARGGGWVLQVRFGRLSRRWWEGGGVERGRARHLAGC